MPVEIACVRWRAALDAADAALDAAKRALPADELARHRTRLADERRSALVLLKTLARDEGLSSRFVHLTQGHDERQLLGLPPGVAACVFNVEGVLVASVELHVASWAKALDAFTSTHAAPDGSPIAAFDPDSDYRRYLDDKPRLEGVRAFLASRGISLPEGDPTDSPGEFTVYGLANGKNELLRDGIERVGVRAYEGSWQYLEAAREIDIRTAVVSASANTQEILERAGLAEVIDACVDGTEIMAEQLRGSPAPDRLLAACSRVDVEPARTAVFETTTAGIAAARAGQFAFVVGIDEAGSASELRDEGADLVVPDLAWLFERHLAAV